MILVDASFGKGRTRTFLLDTGAYSGVLDRAIANEEHLKPRNVVTLKILGNSSDVAETSDWREAVIHQNKVTLSYGAFPTLDLSALSKALGTPIAGIIGWEIFSKYVVKIDYATGEVSFFDTQKFHYLGDGQTFPLQDGHGTHQLIIDAQAELPDCSILPVRLSIDSGSDADAMFNHIFHDAHPTLSGREIGSQSVSISGKPMDESLASFYSIKIGNYSLLTTHTTILRTDTAGKPEDMLDGALGAGILSQFTVYVDYPDGKIIFEPRTDKPPVLAPDCVPK